VSGVNLRHEPVRYRIRAIIENDLLYYAKFINTSDGWVSLSDLGYASLREDYLNIKNSYQSKDDGLLAVSVVNLLAKLQLLGITK
jgi:hypothetical protein